MTKNNIQVHVSRVSDKVTLTLASPDGQVQFEIVLSLIEVVALIDELGAAVRDL